MKCPFCGYEESKVIDSRPTDEGEKIRRRRECISCQKRFTTYEIIESVPIVVVKKDKSRQAFDRVKLFNGMLRACEKRPVSIEQIDRIVSEIEADKKYIVPEDKTVTVEVGNTSIVNFHNKLKPKTPVIYNTGDTTNPVMWLNLAMASLIGLVGMVAVKYVQRKKQKSDKYAQETDQLFDKWWTAYDDTDNE